MLNKKIFFVAFVALLSVVRANAQSPSVDGVVWYYPFDEAQNEMPVEQISGKSAALANGQQVAGVTPIDPIMGRVRGFENQLGKVANRFRSHAKSPIHGKAARSYSFWVYLEKMMKNPGKNGIQPQNLAQVFTTGVEGDGVDKLAVAITSRRHIRLMMGADKEIDFEGGKPLEGGWHHVVVTLPKGGVASRVRCYIDGESLGEPRPYDGNFARQKDFKYSTQQSIVVFGQSLYGKLSRFALYNKALTAGEAKKIYRNGVMGGEAKITKSASAAAQIVCDSIANEIASWKNPFVKHMYTADPSARVYNGRLYVYPSTDNAPPKGFTRMDNHHIFSTDDMVNWTDHGVALSTKDVPWGRKEGGSLWAPDCIERDGTFYYYFPHPSESGHENQHGSWRIGVAVSDRPDGGFKPLVNDPKHPNFKGYIDGMHSSIDPNVFIDDDGQAYIYNGGGRRCYGGKLKDNMIELDGEMESMHDDQGSKLKFGKETLEVLPEFHEATWVFKRKSTYYLMHSDYTEMKDGGNRLLYWMSDSPLGPWHKGGVLLEPNGTSWTSHGSVVEYKGKWYLFYHNAALSEDPVNRSICFDEVHFNADGTIQTVVQTR